MGLLDRVATYFPANVIARHELIYQQRASGQGRRWVRRLGRMMLIAGIVMSMILFWGIFIGLLLNRDAQTIGERLEIGVILLSAGALVWHFVLMFQTLSLAVNSVARERQNNTWEMLILTGIDARQIVRGKWWATVQSQWRNYLLLGLLRVGAMVWLCYAGSQSMTFYYPDYTPPSALNILLAGIIIVILTMANLGFTAACGVLGGVEARRSMTGMVRAVLIRTLSLILLALVIPLGLAALRLPFGTAWYSTDLPNIAAYTVLPTSFTLVDNGLTLTEQLCDTLLGSIAIGYTVAALVLSLLLYYLLTRFMLWMAQRRAIRREHALPPLSAKSAKI